MRRCGIVFVRGSEECFFRLILRGFGVPGVPGNRFGGFGPRFFDTPQGKAGVHSRGLGFPGTFAAHLGLFKGLPFGPLRIPGVLLRRIPGGRRPWPKLPVPFLQHKCGPERSIRPARESSPKAADGGALR